MALNIKFGVMCVLVHLCPVYAVPGSLEDEIARTSKICCSQGTAYGRHSSDPDCSTSSPPNVPPHLRQLCVFTMDHCCKEYIQKKKECDSGVNIATRMKRCDGTIGSAQACCNECKRGTDAGIRGTEGCNSTAGDNQDEILAGNAFQECCAKSFDRNKKQMGVLNQMTAQNISRFPFKDIATTSTTTSTSTKAPELLLGLRRRNYRSRMHCDVGFRLNRITDQCEDIDECTTESHSCSQTETCRNSLGGYVCECKTGYQRDLGTGLCTAGSNFKDSINSNIATQTTPPSTITTSTSTIAPDHQFLNNGPYEVFGSGIQCEPGYFLSRITEKCEDINECTSGEANCAFNEHCINVAGGYTCNLGIMCPIGHRMATDNECVDIDECELAGNQKMCSQNADCVNTAGSFQCKCHTGFRAAPVNDRICVDVDECSESKYLCEHRCNNIWGGYKCSCHRGYRLNSDNRTCSDVDECTENKSKMLCHWKCANEPGSYRCKCPPGYKLSGDMRSCIDIDECDTGEALCVTSKGGYGDVIDVCINTRGSHRCYHISCPAGYKTDNTSISRNRCTKTDRVCPSGDWDCAHQPITYSYNFITFVSQIYLPGGKVDLFTIRGPAWDNSLVTFRLRLLDVNSPPSVRDKADINAFLLTETDHSAIVSLVKPLPGPQSIELELSMEVYIREIFRGTAVAKLCIIVSEYEF